MVFREAFHFDGCEHIWILIYRSNSTGLVDTYEYTRKQYF
jgi:hypothetical protein